MIVENPLVSVLMTAYNREAYIGEAIESVLDSSFQNFELIIVDDVSSDNTVAIAKRYEKRDSRIKVFENEKNLKDYPNRNKAASYAKGKYIKYLDSDDKLYDWGLEYCVKMMEKYPNAGMGIFQASNKVDEVFLIPKDAIHKHFFDSAFLNIGPSGTILNRKAFTDIGFFKPDYGPASDMYFNLKMASLFPVVMLKKEFFFYREHEGQEIRNRHSYLLNNYLYLRDILKLPELPVSSEEKNQLLLSAKRDLLKDCVRSIKNTRKIAPAIKALKHSQMSFKDVISGILNKKV